MNYDFHIFDCDGVILNSNHIKSEAFSVALEGESPSSVDKLVKYHKENGGVSRYKKFDFYFNFINPSEDPQKKINKALELFSKFVYNNLVECDYVPGVVSYINKLKDSGSLCYVNSGGDEEELKKIFKIRGIDHLFESIKGSPISKKSNNQTIMNSLDDNMKGAFYGDSKLDYETAKEFSLDFFYISGYSEWKNPIGQFKGESENFNTILENEDITDR